MTLAAARNKQVSTISHALALIPAKSHCCCTQKAYIGLDARKPDCCMRTTKAQTSLQSDQYLCYSLSLKYCSQTCFMRNLVSIAQSRLDQFESYLFGNLEGLSGDEAHIDREY